MVVPKLLIKILALIAACILTHFYAQANDDVNDKNTWDYEFLETSSIVYVKGVDMNFKQTKISRGVYALSGNLTLNGVVHDNTIMLTMDMLKRSPGQSDFKKTFMSQPTQTLYQFFNGHYKTLLMDSLKNCSNFPVFNDTYAEPLKQNHTYWAKNCILNLVNFPNRVQPGIYKVIYRVTNMMGEKLYEWDVLLNIFKK